MNGPEHYAEAERLLQLAKEFPQRWIDGVEPDQAEVVEALGDERHPLVVTAPGMSYHDNLLVAAQVHATLALAAASAGHASGIPIDGGTGRAWRAAVTS